MLTILIVEDDKGILENLNILLTSEGYNVKTAENGLAALRHLETIIPDLILSDVMMPYLDGFELYKKVRDEYKLLQVPFLFLTAKNDLHEIRQGMALGVDDYITKPFENEDLLQAIRIRLEKRQNYLSQYNLLKENLNKYMPHELRTPLVSIIGYSEIIIDDMDDLDLETVKKMADKIKWSGRKLLNRIEKFVCAYEIESLDKETESEIFSSESVIDNNFVSSVIDQHYLLRTMGDKINLLLQESEVKIHSRYLELIIRELLENACKFSGKSEAIIIFGSPIGGNYVLNVYDKGIGMQKNEIMNISKYQQFNRDKFNQEGSGLGLALVKKILEIFGGSLSIRSKIGSHTNAKVTLQIA